MAKKPNSPTLAFSYLRFSSPEQAKGDSVRRQTELRDLWLSRHDAVLDTTLALCDQGISGYSGKHRENPDRHALARFLDLVRAGHVPRGSYLIVESLDRLTREHIRPALTLLLNLIDHGIRIVQLLPVEAIYDEDVEPMTLMMAIMELSRGNSESRMKSERVGRAWSQKRERAIRDREVLTKRTPAWLAVEGGAFVVKEHAATTVRRIFQLAIDGYGLGQIVKRLNADGMPPIGRVRYWARSYIAKILGNRAVIGEYQPHSIAKGRKRHPTGDAVLDYYPAILSPDRFYAARAALQSRRRQSDGAARGEVNLFTHLLRDARDGGTLFVLDKGKKKGGGKLLVPYRAHQGVPGATMVSFPLGAFERAILSQLREVDLKLLLPSEAARDDTMLSLTGRLATIEGRLAKIAAALVEHGDIGALAGAAKTLEEERVGVLRDLEDARRQAATPLSAAWTSCHSLIDLLAQAGTDEDIRIKLRAAIRRIVSGIWCLFLRQGRKRIALVQIWFHGETMHRDYFIVHHPAHYGFHGTEEPRRTEAHTAVESMRYAGPVDLRHPSCVEEVEAYVRQASRVAS